MSDFQYLHAHVIHNHPNHNRKRLHGAIRSACFLGAMAPALIAHAAENSDPKDLSETRVIQVTPGYTPGIAVQHVPFAVQRVSYEDLEDSGSLDVSDYMNASMASININSAQNNPLQPDVQFRGFTASPLLGLPQGLAVYQDGVRLNEPLGDSVNWDLLPESAVYSMELLSGANPVFGLNALGGALRVTMKNGFNFGNNQLETSVGSWGRTVATIESGNNNGIWGYYVNATRFDEDGWRDLSESEATNFYGSLSWRNNDTSALDFIYQQGKSELIGNGALPVGLLAIQRDAVFTAPDITENDMQMVNINGSHVFSPEFQVSGNVYWRENLTDSFNGDGSEFEQCEYSGGGVSLFEEADAIEDALEDELDIELDAICEGEDDSVTNFEELEELIESQAAMAGLDSEDFELEDVFGDLSGSGVISDEAINNISQRRQESRGFNSQLSFSNDLFSMDNRFITGVSYFRGDSSFDSVLELSGLDPQTRSTRGLGTGTFLDEAETRINTDIKTLSWFFTNTLDLSDRLSIILSGRYNNTDVSLRDQSGERPELNGDHEFSRFNPALGFTFSVDERTTLFGSYSESNRVPTPIELACNEGVFTLARQYAEAEGEDPDDVEFECRLPNAFLADPPLEQVVTKSVEMGLRGQWQNLSYQLAVYNASNNDDIIFQTTGRATGLFANIDDTQRRGFEASLGGTHERFNWQASWSYIEATFEDNFMVLSPNHPNANDDGEVAVQKGDRLPGLPEHILKLGGTYRVTPALRLGAEAIYNSDQVMRGDESNDMDTTGGYALVNLNAIYAFGDNFSVFARVTNLFDREYENFGLLGEDPGEVLPGLADDRPLFLGAGAPRGAWIGLRLRF